MQPLPNSAELATIALKAYYETQSSTQSKSTYGDTEDPPFYKVMTPKRSNRFKPAEFDPEAEHEKYVNEVLENHRNSSRSISSSSRKVQQAQRDLNQTHNMIVSNVKTYNDAVDNFNQTATRIYQREEALEAKRANSVKSSKS